MPDELLSFKPCADVFSFAEQWVHVGKANFLFASFAAGVENPAPAAHPDPVYFRLNGLKPPSERLF